MPELIDAELLRGNVESLALSLAEDPSAGLVRPSVSTSLVKNVHAVSRFVQYGHEFELACDESVERAGEGLAPSPLRYLLSSLAFCMQVWTAKSAALHSADVSSLDVQVDTFMDMRGEHLDPDVPAHPQYFVVRIVSAGTATDRDIATVVDEARRRCPVASLLARAVPVYLIATHNGEQILDERPPSLPL